MVGTRMRRRGLKIGAIPAALLVWLAATVGVAGCQRQAPESVAPATAAATQPDYAPTATIKDLMLGLIDPAADAVWLSVTTVVGSAGTVDTVPRNDDEWAKVKY